MLADTVISPEAFFTVREQTMLFLLSVLMGAGFGVIFDVFRALRVIFPLLKGQAASAVCDVLFFLICGFFVYIFSLTFARGELRAYFAAGALLGGIIYLMTVGTAVMAVIRGFFGLLYGVLRKVLNKIKIHIVILKGKITPKKELQSCNKRQKNAVKIKKSEKHLPKAT